MMRHITNRLSDTHQATIQIRKILTELAWCVFLVLSILHMLATMTPVLPITVA
jgi:hypothetical protein